LFSRLSTDSVLWIFSPGTKKPDISQYDRYQAFFDVSGVRACSEFSRRVKNGSFFTIFQLPGSGHAPSERQKLTKDTLIFANGRKS
jgi:hypothetical protein